MQQDLEKQIADEIAAGGQKRATATTPMKSTPASNDMRYLKKNRIHSPEDSQFPATQPDPEDAVDDDDMHIAALLKMHYGSPSEKVTETTPEKLTPLKPLSLDPYFTSPANGTQEPSMTTRSYIYI